MGKVIDIRLKSPGWTKSLEEEMSVERICGSMPTSASSTLLAEDTDMGDDDYDMEGVEMKEPKLLYFWFRKYQSCQSYESVYQVMWMKR